MRTRRKPEWKVAPDLANVGADVDKREITAYASVFGVIDSYGDIVHRGAFTQTLKERLPKGLIKYLGFHRDVIGKLAHAEEDSTGLLTVGRISKTRAGDEVLELARDGALTHMSFGYEAIKWDTSESAVGDGRIRNLREVKLLEVSPVDFPANEEARILSVKDAFSGAGFSGVEALTDEEAQAVISALCPALPSESPLRAQLESLLAGVGEKSAPAEVEVNTAELAEALTAFAATLRGGIGRE